MLFNIETQKEKFKEHIATFTDHGNIKILDFKNPDTIEYRIRFIFEEDWCRLHISGDLGELIASNYNNMTWENFDDFINNPGYFEEKIDTCSRKLYIYDYDIAKEELKSRFEDYDFTKDIFHDTEEEAKEDAIDEILEDFYDDGLGSKAYEKLSNYDPDCWEYISDIGRERTGIIELYLLAFKLAKEQLERNNHD